MSNVKPIRPDVIIGSKDSIVVGQLTGVLTPEQRARKRIKAEEKRQEDKRAAAEARALEAAGIKAAKERGETK